MFNRIDGPGLFGDAGFGGATAKKYTALFSLEQFIFIKS